MNEVHELHIDVGCYVTDALDPGERVAFEAHLEHCESCSREVLEFSETSAELARLVAMPPPSIVRGSMLSIIRTVRPLPPLVVKAVPGPSTSAPPVGFPAGPGSDELAVRRRTPRGKSPRPNSSRNRVLTALVAAVAVLAVGLGGWVVTLSSQQQTDVASRTAEERQSELLSAPDAKVYTAEGDGAQYTFVVSKQRNMALFLGTELPDPGAGNAFQLWTVRGSRASPDAMVSTGSQWFEGPITTATSLAITMEPAGGSPQPTTPMLAKVSI